MEKTKLVAHTASLNKNLIYYLGKFEKNQQWADVAPLLMKIEQLLKNYPSPYISDKLQLAKRLAQCLNPQLTTPIHLTVLKIYDQVFKNLQNFSVDSSEELLKLTLEDMAIFSVGLFPFFQHASQKVRTPYLELIQAHFVPLRREIVPMVPGLVSSILPGLDDQLEVVQKQVWLTLELIERAVGRRYFLGAVWMALLRIPRCRTSGIKYLSRFIPKLTADEDEEEEDLDSDDSDDEDSDQSQVIQQVEQMESNIKQLDETEVKEIGEEIESSQPYFVQAGNQKQEVVDPVRASKLQDLELGIDDQSGEISYPNKSSLVLNALMACLEDENQMVKRGILDFMYTHLRLSKDEYLERRDKLVLVEAALVLLIRKDLSVSRRVNQWLFGKPDMDNKYQLSEKNEQAIELVIHGLKNIFDVVPIDLQTATFPIKLFQNFYMEHDHMLEQIIPHITFNLIRYLRNFSDGKEFSSEVLKSGRRLIESVASYLMPLVESLTILLVRQNENSLQIVDLIDFFFGSLLGSDFDPQLVVDLTKASVSNILKALSYMQLGKSRDTSLGVRTVQLVYKLLSQLDRYQSEVFIVSEQRDSSFDESLNSFERVYQDIAANLEEGENAQQLFKYASRVLVRGQRLRSEKNVQQLPDWFVCTTRTIRDGSPNFSLLAIECMIEVLVSDKVDPIYNNLRNLVIEEARSRVTGSTTIQGFDYTRLTLENLWNLLDYQYFHDRIINLIVSLSKVFPSLFTEVVVSSFSLHSLIEREAAIRRFAVFWKLTAQYYKAPQCTRELQDLNKVGLFLMLDFLDHDNPMIRHVAKNWLLESMPLLHRILDPLFEVLVQPSNVFYVTNRQQVFFARPYDTRRIHEALKKLKSMLLTYSQPFLSYLMNVELSETVKDIRMHFTQENCAVVTVSPEVAQMDKSPTLSQQLQALPTTSPSMKYLDLLVIICLRYVQGQAIESMSLKFRSENTSVNASACEFLELLVTNLDNAGVSLRLAEFIVPPLQVVLLHAVENSDFVMQVQLLNLFKVVFFSSAFRRIPNPRLLTNIQQTMTSTVSNGIFIPTLIRGMTTSLLYVRAQYISFISTCLPLLAEYLSWQTLTSCVKSVLAAYFTIIKSITMRSGTGEEDKFQTYEYLQGSSQHEISSVLNGVKTILKHIMGLEERDDILYDRQQPQGYSVGGLMFTVFTLGLVGTQQPGEAGRKVPPVFARYQQTCEQIMLSLPSILELYINCWECFDDFLPFADNLTLLGCGSYSFERYNAYNKSLTELLKFSQLQGKDQLKPQVLNMMKPLFMSYSRQFLSGVMHLWARECRDASRVFASTQISSSSNSFLQKTIEILVMMNCPSELMLDSVLECDLMKEVSKYYGAQAKKKKQIANILSFEVAEMEAAIVYFLYNYFKYVYIDTVTLKREALVSFWSSIMNILKALSQSKAPSTVIWLLELVLLLCKKYSPKEIVNDQSRIRNDLHELINEKLRYLAQISAKQIQFFWNEPLSNNKTFRFIFPLSPSVFEIFQGQGDPKLPEIDKLIFQNISSLNDEDIYNKYRISCIKCLRAIGMDVLQTSYSLDRTDRVVLRVKEFMDTLFPILSDKQPTNQLYVELVSELLHTQLEKARTILVKAYRQPILELFNKEDFFIQNKRTLRLWENIINWVVQLDKTDLFSEYLDKVALHSSFLFGNELAENKKRIKSFERICFVIFSGERDRYTQKLWNLIERISDVIKTDNVQPALLILVLFCVRILILRLSTLQLTDLFRNIWPMLLTLLIQLFTKKQETPQLNQSQPSQSKNINLVLAGLKLIEMISIMQQDEFYLNQWVFMFDYFGMNIELLEKNQQKDQKSISVFLYQPYITNFLNAQRTQLIYKNTQLVVQQDVLKIKRRVIITQVKVDTEEELSDCALQLCQYLIQMNELRPQIEPEFVEELIENDFIQLDEFIFKI